MNVRSINGNCGNVKGLKGWRVEANGRRGANVPTISAAEGGFCKNYDNYTNCHENSFATEAQRTQRSNSGVHECCDSFTNYHAKNFNRSETRGVLPHIFEGRVLLENSTGFDLIRPNSSTHFIFLFFDNLEKGRGRNPE